MRRSYLHWIRRPRGVSEAAALGILSAFPAADVARDVNERMWTVRDEWGSVHLANLAGELRLADTVPTLIDCLGEGEGDFLCEAAERGLVRIGEPAAQALSAQWDSLDASQAWCNLAAAVPDRQLIDLIEPHVRRRQHMIDGCFYLLCVLTEHERADLQQIGERVRTYRQRVLERQAAFATGDFRKPDGRIALTLRCENCGDLNRYDIKSVVASNSTSGLRTSSPTICRASPAANG
jgi:hypothetical protein